MQKVRFDDQLTKEEIHVLTSLDNQLFRPVPLMHLFLQLDAKNFVMFWLYASLVNYDGETSSKFLFGDNIADKEEKHSKERRIIKKTSKNSFQQSSHPMPNNQFRVFRSGSNTFN